MDTVRTAFSLALTTVIFCAQAQAQSPPPPKNLNLGGYKLSPAASLYLDGLRVGGRDQATSVGTLSGVSFRIGGALTGALGYMDAGLGVALSPPQGEGQTFGDVFSIELGTAIAPKFMMWDTGNGTLMIVSTAGTRLHKWRTHPQAGLDFSVSAYASVGLLFRFF